MASDIIGDLAAPCSSKNTPTPLYAKERRRFEGPRIPKANGLFVVVVVVMEVSQCDNPNPNPNRNSYSISQPLWPTIDGPLGLSEEDSLCYARRFYKFGFALLPWLWAVNCFYFWPVLRHSRSFPRLRRYVVGSAVGFVAFTAILSSWALAFAIGGEHLFGPVWNKLVMYNVADRLGLTGWI